MKRIERPASLFDARFLQKHTPGGQDHDQQNHAGGGAGPALAENQAGFPAADSTRDVSTKVYGPDEEDVGQMTHEAVSYYSQDGYRDIDEYLRTGQIPAGADPVYAKNIPKYVEKLDAFTTDSFNDAPPIVFRGTGALAEGFDADSFIRGYEDKVGKTVTFPGYQSTSATSRVAARHAGAEGNPIFEIKAKTGAPLGRLSEHPGENEILLPRGRTFRVVSVQRGAKFQTDSGVKSFTAIRLIEV